MYCRQEWRNCSNGGPRSRRATYPQERWITEPAPTARDAARSGCVDGGSFGGRRRPVLPLCAGAVWARPAVWCRSFRAPLASAFMMLTGGIDEADGKNTSGPGTLMPTAGGAPAVGAEASAGGGEDAPAPQPALRRQRASPPRNGRRKGHRAVRSDWLLTRLASLNSANVSTGRQCSSRVSRAHARRCRTDRARRSGAAAHAPV